MLKAFSNNLKPLQCERNLLTVCEQTPHNLCTCLLQFAHFFLCVHKESIFLSSLKFPCYNCDVDIVIR